MPDLRDRLHALDDLEVPDVMQQARRLGPKPPMDRGPRPSRRIAIAAFALFVGAASVLYVSRAFDRSEAPLPPVETPDQAIRCQWSTSVIPIDLEGASARAATRLVAGTSLNDLWVIVSNNPWIDQHLVHYDGQQWTEIELPADLRRFFSSDMVATAPNELWLLAPHGVARFDGTNWTRLDIAGLEDFDQSSLDLNDLEVVAPNDVWVTGLMFGRTSRSQGPVIQHWDGTAWSSIDIPAGEDEPRSLVGVSAWAPNDVWIAGASDGNRQLPVALHWDGTGLSTRPARGPGVRAVPSDEFGLVAIGPDEALMTIDKGVVRWEGGGWVDTGFEAASSMDVPLIMEQGTTGVWAKVWNTAVARWNGETWRQEPLEHLYSHGLTVIDGSALFVGDPLRISIIGC